MAIDISQFYQVFFEESAEHLAVMESLLLKLDIEHPDQEDLNAVFRAAHSIKGNAATFGFADMANLTHILESLLDRVRKGELSLSTDMVECLLASADLLRLMLSAHQGQGRVVENEVEALRLRLEAFSTGGGNASACVPAEARLFDIQFVPTLVSASQGGVQRLLGVLASFGSLEIVGQPEATAEDAGFWHVRLKGLVTREVLAEHVAFIAESGAWRVEEENPAVDDPGYGFFDDLPPCVEEGDGYGFFMPLPALDAPVELPSVAEEGDGYGFFAPLPPAPVVSSDTPESLRARGGDETPSARPAKTAGASVSEASIRVSVEKVDQLIDLVGELVITQSMLQQTTQLFQGAAAERLLAGIAQLERNTRDLQESVMSIRMLPISFAFSRFPRVVHDLSSKLGKEVELKTFGENTELDKGLIERIVDPLTHLIRNSLDHGIELPEQRVALGKRPVGTITLKASHQGGAIVIEVGDDGAGLRRDRILAKARERGLPVSDQMSDQEVFNLIFEAGFSTAEQVTDVSGRGVGMDVVRRNIQSMGGRVEIESMPGVGTRMTVRLPLTLAILDGMSVALGEQTYILPLSYVLESFQPMPGQVKTVSNQGRVVQVRSDYLPLVDLHEVFNTPALPDFSSGIMIVVEADGARAVLFVDALLGQHQVVIKSLESNFRRVPGVSGATIMGDGRVALILDVPAIAGQVRNRQTEPD
jgi:two-component system chemotaxis sensor kinase CheA